jgi:predicted nucleic acid-binding protein
VIVLDTNVLSELMRTQPAEAVLRWTAHQPAQKLFTTALSEAEVRHGVALRSAGRKKVALERAVEQMFAVDFDGRVLAFDREAAREFARIASTRRAAGVPIS